MVVRADLGDEDVAAREHAARRLLGRHAERGLAHRRRPHVLDVSLPAESEIGALRDRGQIIFGDAGARFTLQRFDGEVAERGAATQKSQLLGALDQAEPLHRHGGVYECRRGERATQRLVALPGEWPGETNALAGQSPAPEVFRDRLGGV